MSVAELTYQEFTPERYGEFFRTSLREAGLALHEAHFFQTWQLWMELGMARIWSNDNCMLGAIFTHDLFSQKLRAQVVFWFSRPEIRKTAITAEVFRAFEAAAREAGCSDIQAASHESLDPIRREKGHLKNGFRRVERIFQKDLL